MTDERIVIALALVLALAISSWLVTSSNSERIGSLESKLKGLAA